MFFGLAMALMTDCYTPKPTDPPGSDRHHFPHLHICQENVKFSKQYIQHIEFQQCLYPHLFKEYDKILKDAEWCHRCWSRLEYVQMKPWNETSDRCFLGKIREMVGEEAYYGGQMPPHVPIWHFQKIP